MAISGNALLAWLSAIVLLGAGPAAYAQTTTQIDRDGVVHKPPTLLQSGRGQFIPELPGTPMPMYQLQIPETASWLGEDEIIADIRARIYPENLEFVSSSPSTHTIVFKTTRFAAEHMFRNVRGELSLLKDAAPELRCARVLAEVAVGNIPLNEGSEIEWVRRDNGECVANRRFDPLQNLLAEGIDEEGTQLFVVITRDPRWYHHETFSDDGNPISGPEGMEDLPSMTLRIEAPISDELTRIRIWEMGLEDQLDVIAEIPFEVPE